MPPPSTWTEGVHSKLDSLRNAIEENTKATSAMSSTIRMLYLVPLAIAAMYLAWLGLSSKALSEATFTGIFLVCLSPFFGEGIKRVLDGFLPWRRDNLAKSATLLVGTSGLLLALIGCTKF